MKVSIITATYNSAETIKDTLISVNKQTYKDIEHIIIDGGSRDNTLEIVEKYGERVSIIVSEPDKGIYDAMNKGIRSATGDVVGILNSDDFFASDDVIETVANTFINNPDFDSIYGNIHFVSPDNLNKITRKYSSKIFRPALFRFGFMPAHPSFYVRRKFFEQYDLYKLDYKIAADYELLIRYLYIHKISHRYINKDFVTMRTGGVSTENTESRKILNKEIIRACKENGIYTNSFLVYMKYLYKIFEFRF